MSKSNTFFNWICIFVSVYLIIWGAITQGKITQAINNSTKNGSGSHDFKDDNGKLYTADEIFNLRILSIIAMIFGASTFLSSSGAFAIELDNRFGFSTLQYPFQIKAVFGVLLILILVGIVISCSSHNDKTGMIIAGVATFFTAVASAFQYKWGDTVFEQDKDVNTAFEELAETHGLTRRQRSELNACIKKQAKIRDKLQAKKKSIEKLSKGLLTIDGNQVVDLGKSNDDLMEENKQLSAALQQKSKKLEQMENDYDDETGDDDEYDLDGEELGLDDDED